MKDRGSLGGVTAAVRALGAIMDRPGRGRKARAAFLPMLILALAASACATPQRPAPAPIPEPVAQAPAPEPEPEPQPMRPPRLLEPRHFEGREPVRVALLLPFGSEQAGVRDLAGTLSDAAQLALFRIGNPNLLLMVKDTAGTPDGARAAALDAVDEGAEIVLGPLFAGNVDAVAPIAAEAGLPVVAFSSDRSVARPGVYLLSFLPESEVDRVVEFAMTTGRTSFAALVPQTAYGERVRGAFNETVYANGGEVEHLVDYRRDTDAYHAAAKIVAERAARRAAAAPLPDGAPEDAEPRLPPVSYDAVLIAEGGEALRELATLLPFYDVDRRRVQFLGTGLWDNESLWREPVLNGGWFAGPTPASWETFRRTFSDTFGYEPQRLASLAFDAVALTAALAATPAPERFSEAEITTPVGFNGVDGLFRFTPDGHTERGLAVLEIRNGEIAVVDPAPTRFPSDPGGDMIGTGMSF